MLPLSSPMHKPKGLFAISVISLILAENQIWFECLCPRSWRKTGVLRVMEGELDRHILTVTQRPFRLVRGPLVDK